MDMRANPAQEIRGGHLGYLRCPVSGRQLLVRDGSLQTEDGKHRYRISAAGVPLFAESVISADAERQRSHYDRVAAAFEANLGYPHTRAYLDYLDEVFQEVVGNGSLGVTAELCCGHGEVLSMLGRQVTGGVGVDISEEMLKTAVLRGAPANWLYVQGDATRLPLADATFDSVVIFGGIHHVNDRRALFAEVARILKPGGHFYFREPLNDFWLWRLLRAVIYRVAPALDHQTERPLRHDETVPPLRGVGLDPVAWRPCGFLGFCLFMNSDVLVFNRIFRVVPNIGRVVRWSTRLDDWLVRLPFLRHAGLQVAAAARKPGP